MQIFSTADVDRFLDKFQDPSQEVDEIIAALRWFLLELPAHRFTDEQAKILRYFVERLIMKSYRYGKEHGTEGALRIIREQGSKRTFKEDRE